MQQLDKMSITVTQAQDISGWYKVLNRSLNLRSATFKGLIHMNMSSFTNWDY